MSENDAAVGPKCFRVPESARDLPRTSSLCCVHSVFKLCPNDGLFAGLWALGIIRFELVLVGGLLNALAAPIANGLQDDAIVFGDACDICVVGDTVSETWSSVDECVDIANYTLLVRFF